MIVNKVFDKKQHLTTQSRSFECSHAVGLLTFSRSFKSLYHFLPIYGIKLTLSVIIKGPLSRYLATL